MTSLSFSAVLLCAALLTCQAQAQLLVNTTYGPIEGIINPANPSVSQYLGVPYAAPPVGDLRLKPSIAPEPWTSPKKTQSYPASCLQNEAVYYPESEDCLYLNVFVPSNQTAGTALPVMVWFYGGSFVSGGTSLFVYHGEHMAEQGNVVVVTVNYRLGALGFFVNDQLAKEDPTFPTSGNYGLLDQQFALKWVRNNIAAFGGDPLQVTIFGESAGAMSVCFHMVMPGSRGLFHKAIMESGPCLQGTTSPATYYNMTRRANESIEVMASVGCHKSTPAESIACLRQADGKTIVKNERQELHGWFPVVDNYTILEDPVATFESGRAADVEVLLGTNTNEGTMFVRGGVNISLQDFRDFLLEEFPVYANKIYAQYNPASYASPFAAAADMITDFFFLCPSRRLLNYRSKQSTNLFQYHYAHRPSWIKCPGFFCKYNDFGVFHSSELFFVWDNPFPFTPFTPAEAVLSKAMLQYWTSFATFGAPVAASQPSWPSYSGSQQLYQVLNTTTIYSARHYKQKACDFWDAITV